MSDKVVVVPELNDLAKLAMKVERARRHWENMKDQARDAKNLYDSSLEELFEAFNTRRKLEE